MTEGRGLLFVKNCMCFDNEVSWKKLDKITENDRSEDLYPV